MPLMKPQGKAALEKLLKKVDAVMGPRNRTRFINQCVLQFGPVVLRNDLQKRLKNFQKMEQRLDGQKRP